MRITSFYRTVAINTLNTLILLLVINLLLAGFFAFKDSRRQKRNASLTQLFNSDGTPVDNGKRLQSQLEWFDYDATKEINERETAEVLDDFYELAGKGFMFQPWASFSEPPFASKHANVVFDEKGFPVRKTLNPPADPAKSAVDVFVLGGSTTFGYYVSDDHTWPTYLSTILNERAEREGLNVQVRVTNYGHATFYPTQETALCMDLFRNGYRPNLVIFMDGVNWGPLEDNPFHTAELARAFNSLQHVDADLAKQHFRAQMVKWFPMFRLAGSLRQRFFGSQSPESSPAEAVVEQPTKEEAERTQYVVERFRQSTRTSKRVCEEYGSAVMSFLQPDAAYNYPVSLLRPSRRAVWQLKQKERQLFYSQMWHDPDFIWLADAFDRFGVQQGKKAVLDGVHYNPSFNQFLAETVAARIDLKKIATSGTTAVATPTGQSRQRTYQ